LNPEAIEREAIERMSVALASVCATIGLALVDDPATRLVVQKIIELVSARCARNRRSRPNDSQ